MYNTRMNKKRKPEEKKFIEARASGLSVARSAIIAGIPPITGKHLLEKPDVKQEVAIIREKIAETKGASKDDVIGMLVDAGNMARIAGDPSGLVAAARELGKMLGYYAVEVKKTLHGVDKNDLKKALEELSDEELRKLASAKVIDGEYTRVLDAPDENMREVQEGKT